MKYLKIFENNSGFTEITDEEFRSIIIPNNTPFENEEADIVSTSELQEIEGILTEYDVKLMRSVKATKMCKINAYKKREDSNTQLTVVIYSITKFKDEWFFLEYNPITNWPKINRKYYKCDQISGLIDCIKSIKK